ncbi:MAG: acetyl-CoA carboxylase biotin carboxyl carrier protein [Phycisphaerae bacterium]
MNIDDIRQLVELMVENDLSELDITDGETKVSLKRGAGGEPVVREVTQLPAQQAAAPPAESRQSQQEPEEPVEQLLEITSPMVGTFYAADSPDGDPYVQVGSNVDEETVVGIVEAMKVMNEVKAECRGAIAEICVHNAQPVEYGQVLFKVRPA